MASNINSTYSRYSTIRWRYNMGTSFIHVEHGAPPDIRVRPASASRQGQPELPPAMPLAALREKLSQRSLAITTTGDRPLNINLGGANQALNLLTPRSASEFIKQQRERDMDLEETVDPITQSKPQFSIPWYSWLVFLLAPLVMYGYILVCFGIDKATETIFGTNFSIKDVITASFTPELDQGRSVMEGILNTMSLIFGLLITVSGIVLQLSSKFTSHVTKLFFNDSLIQGVLLYIILCNAFAFWTYLSISNSYIPRAAVVLSVWMVCSQVLLLFPFVFYVFYFLQNTRVVQMIKEGGITAAIEGTTLNRSSHLDKHQARVTLAIENLMDAATVAIDKKDKNITAAIIDAVCSFTIHYGAYKGKMKDAWFEIPVWIRQSPDFLALSDEAYEEMTKNKTWFEWKVLKQYQLLFSASLKHMKELSYHVAMNTRYIAESAGKRADYAALDLCIKFFNTYIRASINVSDIRTVYNVLFQYRKVGEYLIVYGRQISGNSALENPLELRAVKVAKFLRYYAYILTITQKMFLVQVIAHDIRVLCETAFNCGSCIHDKLLSTFLTMEDGSDPDKNIPAFDGVRTAQVILATTYLAKGNVEHARRIYEDMQLETAKRLWKFLKELQNETNREFWEVSERGVNFMWISEEQRAQLPVFFGWFKNFTADGEIALDPIERKKMERTQALHNFKGKDV